MNEQPSSDQERRELQAGLLIGPYRIEATLGKGGMGTVYRAFDTRLNRPVAIKVLSDQAADAAARQRFQREAQMVSSLNHPHILTVHDAGEFEGRQHIVMEFVDGGTLKDWSRERHTWKQVVDLMTGVADGLALAHGAGVLHRDIKPGNILVSRSGYAKLADFGLAKLAEGRGVEADLTNAVTVTGPGVILGTLAYMSPEQALGKNLDARSDIFSFGVVLYELLSGRRPFVGTSDSETLRAIAVAPAEPLPANVPTELRMIVEKAIEKDPADRYQTARDLVVDLRRTLRQKEPGLPIHQGEKRRNWMAWGLAAVFAVAAATLYLTKSPPNAASYAFEVRPPEGGEFRNPENPDEHVMNVSPDGRYLAFSATLEGRTRIWIRRLDDTSLQPLEGSDNGYSPFWSPDSKRVAFFADQQLKTIELRGGPPTPICMVPTTARTGSWSEAGGIIFSDYSTSGGIFHVDSEGGTPKRVAVPGTDAAFLVWPEFLPDGNQFLYLSQHLKQGSNVWVGSLTGHMPKLVMQENSHVSYSPSGHLLFARAGALLKQRFNLSTLQLEGEATPILDQIQYFLPTGLASFSVSQTGVLAYQPFGSASRLAWMDRNGKETATVLPLVAYLAPRLSPDNKRLAVSKFDPRSGTEDIHVADLENLSDRRITSYPGDEFSAVWSPDSRTLVFSMDKEAIPFMHKIALDGGSAEPITTPTGGVQFPTDWLKDGILYNEKSIDTNNDLWLLPPDGKPRKLLATRFDEVQATVSPDGHWLAYVSDELDGRAEVYVRSYPQLGESRRISLNGGTWPRWARDGRELYFLERGRLLVVPTRLGSEFHYGNPTVLLQPSTNIVDYDVAANGMFLVNLGRVGYHVAPIRIQTNWNSSLTR
jgi:eukaryotic-like serine/threonine-protein kinase